MQHVKQTDSRCRPIIQKSGCFLRSCGLISEIKTGKSLSPEYINGLWDFAISRGYINEENNVIASAPIATEALHILGDKGHWSEVGTIRDGIPYWYPAVSVQYRHADACIQKILQNGPQGTHFRVVDNLEHLIEDPHEPEIRVRGIKYTIMYAYIPFNGKELIDDII